MVKLFDIKYIYILLDLLDIIRLCIIYIHTRNDNKAYEQNTMIMLKKNIMI